MEIKAQDVKKLRDKTGAGMLDCKNALVKAEGDFAKAEKILKELGLAAAAKRSDRATKEGRIFSKVTGKNAGLLELSCETDFVARNTDFIELGNTLLSRVLEENLKGPSETLEAPVKEAIGRIKENINLRRFTTLEIGEKEYAAEYIHGEGSIGVLVKLKADSAAALANDKVKQFAFDCALHIAAFNPMFLSPEAVDPAYLKEQEEIFTVQAKNLGKPDNVVAGIVKGKVNKHLAEICLVKQGFVKDDKIPVEKVLEDLNKEVGGTITIADYRYYRVGEEN
ncbi:MAG: elongation factor Ts [Spirochaetales bacterium]|nr:elongation factor Ts [Spirochaetales bacterium]